MKKKEFYSTVAQYAQLEFCQIENLSLEELIENVILPKICFCEPHKVSSNFMVLMIEFGQEIRKENPAHGDALYALALQRLFRDGSCFFLPPLYLKYCLEMDVVYGTKLGIIEWTFLQTQSEFLFRNFNNLHYSHMTKIMMDLLEKISPEGQIRESSLLPSNQFLDGKILRDYAEKMALEYVPFSTLYQRFATPDKWKNWPELFLDTNTDWADFAKKIGVKGFFKAEKAKCLLTSYVKGSV